MGTKALQKLAALRAARPGAFDDSDLVGKFTFPYRRPPGTRAVEIVRVEGSIVHTADGGSLHRTHVTLVSSTEVA